MGDDKNNKADTARMLEALRVLQEGMTAKEGEPSVSRIMALLTIAQHTYVNGDIDQNELSRILSIPVDTTSRTVAALSSLGDRGREALNLVDVRFDPRDRRRRLISTNSKGDALIKKALARLHGR